MKVYTPLYRFLLQTCILAGLLPVPAAGAAAQEKATVSGTVSCRAEDGNINFATVYFKGTHFGAQTDENGFWSVTAPEGSYTLVVSAVGYRTVEKRIMLQIVCGDKKYYALNEAALSGSLCRVAEVTVEIDGTLADKVRADGMLVSTPTGSTAYSLACNGPVLSPDVEAFIINAICPHSLHSCPIVVGSGSQITLKSESEGLNLVVDGTIVEKSGKNITLQIGKAPVSAEFIRFSKQNFYNRLLHKLSNWS